MLLKNDVFNSTSKNPAGMPAFLREKTQIEFSPVLLENLLKVLLITAPNNQSPNHFLRVLLVLCLCTVPTIAAILASRLALTAILF